MNKKKLTHTTMARQNQLNTSENLCRVQDLDLLIKCPFEKLKNRVSFVVWTLRGLLMVFFSSGSQYWYFSHEPSSLFYHSVLVDLSVSMMMH